MKQQQSLQVHSALLLLMCSFDVKTENRGGVLCTANKLKIENNYLALRIMQLITPKTLFESKQNLNQNLNPNENVNIDVQQT